MNVTIGDLQIQLDNLEVSLNIAWILLTGILVFWMQTGFLVLESGIVRLSSSQNIVMKNILDILLTAICYWILGFGFSFGVGGNGFIGHANFGLDDFTDYHLWFFFWTFLAASSTIVSGAMAERTSIFAYFIITCTMSSWVWPVVAHWAWSADGWLSPFRVGGCCFDFIDFAGSTVVHVVGGLTGLVGATALGPRLNRWSREYKKDFDPNNPINMIFGTFILWFGWYGFNAGSTLAITGVSSQVAARVVLNTTLSPCFSGLLVFFLSAAIEGHYSLANLANGILVGLVSITAGCAVVAPWGAMIIGIVAGPLFYGASCGLKYLEIDDPLDAFPVHGVGGAWGTLALALFATQDGMSTAYGFSSNTAYHGVFIPGSNGQLLGAQLIGLVSIILWTLLWTVPLIYGLKAFKLLRIGSKEEAGLDQATFGVALGFWGARNGIDMSVFREANVPILYDITLGAILGKGNFGEVVKGDWKGEVVALKTISETDAASFSNELQILADMRHPSVLAFYGLYRDEEDNEKVFMVTEFMDKGDLRSLLISDVEITLRQLLTMATQAASGIEYLHSKNIIHRDIACRNLLVSSSEGSYRVKIADFGMSRVAENYYKSQNNLIPVRWTAPEALSFQKYTKASDVWSFGVTLWEIFSRGVLPFSGMKHEEVIKAVNDGLRLDVNPLPVPTSIKIVIKACWAFEAKKRPPMKKIHKALANPDTDTAQFGFVQASALRVQSQGHYGLVSENSDTYFKDSSDPSQHTLSDEVTSAHESSFLGTKQRKKLEKQMERKKSERQMERKNSERQMERKNSERQMERTQSTKGLFENQRQHSPQQSEDDEVSFMNSKPNAQDSFNSMSGNAQKSKKSKKKGDEAIYGELPLPEVSASTQSSNSKISKQDSLYGISVPTTQKDSNEQKNNTDKVLVKGDSLYGIAVPTKKKDESEKNNN